MIIPEADIDDDLKVKANAFRGKLVDWFQKNSRDFSWRHSSNPFHLLVVEFLLRKTQAERVEPVFNKFCAKYEKPQDVLNVSPESLFELLGKLGLRKRVFWLIEACNQLVTQYNNELPCDYNELCKLKGVGPYTASMVFLGLHRTGPPPIDNNISRLLSRVFSIKRVGDTRREKKVEKVLKLIFANGDPRIISYAMLDLAGIVCVASKPKSGICPLNSICCFNLGQNL